MAYKVIILYRLYMPSYFLGTFTEYPFEESKKNINFHMMSPKHLNSRLRCFINTYSFLL